ncbi:MAG: putative DNA modification/repair radical SAM protein [Spirochaetaceae bacterium]|jgi:putative DNA modification/repair radical SAM protein|nr:putative DNA modification/repair radical SAM protein [Spirochaetaceae bacterium]
MDLEEKLSILAAAAKYDASCASSGSEGRSASASKIPGASAAVGYRERAGVCHSWTGDGRCVSLLKVLYSNVCCFDCAYCVNRVSSDHPRSSFSAQELVDLTIQFYRRNYIEGLFLSSGIFADPDIVMEKLIETARKLRTEAGFGGYIHLKIIPGAGAKAIREAGLWADRLSVNIELPTGQSLQKLAPQKEGPLIFGAMGEVSETEREYQRDRKTMRSVPEFTPSGQSTQLIVGASPEDDRTIINLSGSLYRKFGLRRVYYSAFTPVGGKGPPDPRLPALAAPPVKREHRLYQADWLLRFYHFSPAEILDGNTPFLDTLIDPKAAWALRHLEFFPIEINRASYEELLRVPGIGAVSARRIVETRHTGGFGPSSSRALSFDKLRRLGVSLKRARYFITIAGAFIDQTKDAARLRNILAGLDGGLQLPLFDF